MEAIANKICFFNEHVDLLVGDRLIERPVTPWS